MNKTNTKKKVSKNAQPSKAKVSAHSKSPRLFVAAGLALFLVGATAYGSIGADAATTNCYKKITGGYRFVEPSGATKDLLQRDNDRTVWRGIVSKADKNLCSKSSSSSNTAATKASAAVVTKFKSQVKQYTADMNKAVTDAQNKVKSAEKSVSQSNLKSAEAGLATARQAINNAQKRVDDAYNTARFTANDSDDKKLLTEYGNFGRTAVTNANRKLDELPARIQKLTVKLATPNAPDCSAAKALVKKAVGETSLAGKKTGDRGVFVRGISFNKNTATVYYKKQVGGKDVYAKSYVWSGNRFVVSKSESKSSEAAVANNNCQVDRPQSAFYDNRA